MTYGFNNKADITIKKYLLGLDNTSATISYRNIDYLLKTPLIGKFNLYNLLAAITCAQEIAKQMRESDAFIHAAINEPCSNAIIEAMACGLPLLFKDSGSNRELAGEYGIPLTDNFVDEVNILQNGYSRLRDRVLHDRSKFLMESAAAQYVKSFERALEH